MPLVLEQASRFSKIVRRELTDRQGFRKIDFSQAVTNIQGRQQNVIQRVLNWGRSFLNWGIGKLFEKLRSIKFADIWEKLRVSKEEIMQFDWNASDSEIDEMIRQHNLNSWAVWGELFGRATAFAVVFIFTGAVSLWIPVIGGAALQRALLTGLVTERGREMVDELQTALRQHAENDLRARRLSAFKQIRKSIKLLAHHVRGDNVPEWLRKWGEEGGRDFRIADEIERRIESMEDERWRVFAEEFLEGFDDEFWESGYVVAQGIDDFIAANRMAEGKQVAAEVQLDDRNPDEKILVYGRDNNARAAMITTLNTHQMIHNRDIGIVGNLEEEGIHIPREYRQSLTIFWYSVPRPPWRHPDGARAKRRQCKIANPKLSLNWTRIKRAAGGSSGLNAGKYYAVARLDSRRKMKMFGTSEQDARSQLEEMLELSQDNAVKINVGSEEKHSRQGALRSTPNDAIIMYPGKMEITRRRFTFSEEREFTLEGHSYTEEKEIVDLWPDDVPENGRVLFDGE